MHGEENVHDRVHVQFGQNAVKYVTSESHAHGSDLKELLMGLSPNDEQVALDIATGGGHVAKTIAPFVKTVYVTDLTPQMLSAARTHLLSASVHNAVYICADAEALPFLDGTFDIVTCRIAPHHFPHPDQFVREVARVLKPGGRFGLIDNVAPEDRGLGNFVNLLEQIRDPSHVRCLPVSEWLTLLEDAGLSITTTATRKKTFQFDEWVHRMAPTNAHIRAAEALLRMAPDEAARYFEVKFFNDGIESWTIDQWMAIAASH